MAPLTSVCPRGSVLRRPAPVKAEMHRPAPVGGGPGLDRVCSAEWGWVRANAGSAGHSPALLILGDGSTSEGPPAFVSHHEIYFVEICLNFEVSFDKINLRQIRQYSVYKRLIMM